MLVACLLFALLFVGLGLLMMLHTLVSNLNYLIELIEYGDKKNGRAPILPEAKP